MLLNLPSRIILNLIFRDLERFLKNLIGCDNMAVSPILNHGKKQHLPRIALTLKTAIHEFTVFISYEGFTADEMRSIGNYIKENLDQRGAIVKLLFKREMSFIFSGSPPWPDDTSPEYEIAVSVRDVKHDCVMRIAIPYALLKNLLHLTRDVMDASDMEKALADHFRNPALLIPDARALIETLDPMQLGSLLNRLQSGNRLSVYHMVLLILAYPDLSLKIKNCLSRNTIDDVIDHKKNIDSYKINKRDILGGVYSFEESIFMLMRSGSDFGFSRYLSEIGSTIRQFLGMDLLFSKDFIAWIEEMASAGLLYETITRCSEDTVAMAVISDSKTLVPFLGKVVSGKKIESITSAVNKTCDYGAVLESRLKMISTYRHLKMRRTRQDHDSLDYLLAKFKNERDYLFVLIEVGWFVLSTALKGAAKKNVQRTMKYVPEGARFLIEDVLAGTVNPNILHDEIQVNRAKALCVKAIQSLYEDGIIALED
ncbi:MAG TPA: hypothetical protein PK573_01555 [Spirochaetota bacterium]|nr:hypothetical protein [Spirochaetota bacterium]HRZ25594.1 hypothetical protein [Spirochaetota bacterium]HSA15224.1 hypothetical protein [Spirochaetota bacterium]